MEKSAEIKNMVVYQHRRNDTGAIFYIGIGSCEKRAYKLSGRNKHWHNIANKYGYSVEFLYKGLQPNEACDIEKQLIQKYGRICDGGILVNSSIGGEITALGCKQTEERKKQRSIRFTGVLNPMFGKKRPDVSIYMKKFAEKKRIAIVECNKRKKSKPVIAISKDGIETVFSSQREASRQLGVDQSRIWHILQGKAKTTGNYTFKNY